MKPSAARLETARAVFHAHLQRCELCQRYHGKTSEPPFLCLQGTLLFKQQFDPQE